MPIQSPTFFVPASLASGTGGLHPYETTLIPPFVVEDIYLRGGFRCLPSNEIRDKLPLASCKVGMVVFTPDLGGKLWQLKTLEGNTLTWEELDMSGGYTGRDPIGITAKPDNTVYIDPLRVLPEVTDKQTGELLAQPGDVVVLGTDRTPQWQAPSGSGFSGVRSTKVHTCGILDAYNAPSEDFVLNLGKTLLLLKVSVDIPDVLIQAHSTSEMLDKNPYKFISTETLLNDEGITELNDGSYVRGRRYSILANLDDPVNNASYWHVQYLANTDASKDSAGAVIQYRQPTVTLTYLTLE